jgi:phospholipid transport system substrate-binding protein
MGRIFARPLWILVLLFEMCSVHVAWAGAPTDQLRDSVERVLNILRDPALGGDQRVDERQAAISKVADELFDFAEAARRSLGPYWAQRTPAEREDFVGLFTALVQRTYLSKLDRYSSQTTFRGDSMDGDHAIARTTLAVDGGSAMALDYLMHRPKERWQVYDLNIDGISVVANYRAQFNKIIRSSSYRALVTTLKARQADFSSAAATPSGAKPVR